MNPSDNAATHNKHMVTETMDSISAVLTCSEPVILRYEMDRNVLFRSTQAHTGGRIPQSGGTSVAVTVCLQLYGTQCCTRIPCLAISSNAAYERHVVYECRSMSVVRRYMSHPPTLATQTCTKRGCWRATLNAAKTSRLPGRTRLATQLVVL